MPATLANPVSILIADDDPQDTLLVQMAVKRAGLGLKLESVQDGEEAINYLMGREPYADQQPHPVPKMMLLDLKMPRLSGFDVLDFVRKQPGLRQMPVIIFSSSNDPKDVRRAYDSGANSY